MIVQYLWHERLLFVQHGYLLAYHAHHVIVDLCVVSLGHLLLVLREQFLGLLVVQDILVLALTRRVIELAPRVLGLSFLALFVAVNVVKFLLLQDRLPCLAKGRASHLIVRVLWRLADPEWVGAADLIFLLNLQAGVEPHRGPLRIRLPHLRRLEVLVHQ